MEHNSSSIFVSSKIGIERVLVRLLETIQHVDEAEAVNKYFPVPNVNKLRVGLFFRSIWN